MTPTPRITLDGGRFPLHLSYVPGLGAETHTPLRYGEEQVDALTRAITANATKLIAAALLVGVLFGWSSMAAAVYLAGGHFG